jgi:hypothetical protein
MTPAEMRFDDPLVQLETLHNVMTSRATGGPGDDTAYRRLRAGLIENPVVAPFLPRFVTSCRDVSQFWSHIKGVADTYQERREYLRAEFEPAFAKLEGRGSPSDSEVSDTLSAFDADSVHLIWSRALARRVEDPEGAITLARTLLETVCKHVLDAVAVSYDATTDLPKLYRLTATKLNLAPDQHQEAIFRQILGGCQTVVEGLGAVRNRLGDAHGQGKLAAKPSPRHAELAVNLAGAMATFLVQTWSARAPNSN